MNRCPKCGSPNKYVEGINFACMMCGTRWPINGATPIIIKKEARDIDDADILKLTEGETMAIKASRIRPCRNCGRTKAIQADGLCGACNGAVYKKFTKGTPEYTAALAEAKKRVSDPNFRKGCRTAKPRPSVKVKISPDQLQGVISNLSATVSTSGKIKKIKTHVRALSIKHNGGDPEMAGVIAAMQMERERLLAKADKLQQAIELLQ